ncbi:MAG: C4-dicarboxylate transporter DcuC [Ancrocorticia sp.]|uniref:C4-dicarboxylate transporter DcuC n=1 Tax=Ancrocorticia sp. TaxID=2593684 RepID=UPI003F8E4D45
MVSVIIGLVMIGITAYMVLKRYYPQAVLLASGLVMIFLSIPLQDAELLDAETTTGSAWLDAFDLIRITMADTFSGLGMTIMAVGGFALYMEKIGASSALVEIAAKPLQKVKKPYLILALTYVVGQALCIVIPSAAGLAMLLMVTVYPLLISIGISRLSAAGVIATASCLDIGPSSANSILAADLSDMSVQVFFISFQGPVVLVTVLVIAVMHGVVQYLFDKRQDTMPGTEIHVPVGSSTAMVKAAITEENRRRELKAAGEELPPASTIDVKSLMKAEDGAASAEKSDVEELQAPKWYAIMPVLPLILVIIFSEFVISSVTMDVVTAMLVCTIFSLICETIRLRSLSEGLQSLKIFFEGMGRQLANVVSLVIAGQLFAEGLIQIGFIDTVINAAQDANFGLMGMAIVLSLVILGAAIVTGSGNAAWLAFGPLSPQVASSVGQPTVNLALPMELSSGIGRSMSPIAGVVIVVSGMAGVNPIDVVKRTIPVMLVGWLTMMACGFIFH